MTTIYKLGKEIEKKERELEELRDKHQKMLEGNEILMEYYSERFFCEDEIKPYQRRMDILDKLIYLEENGIDTEKELKGEDSVLMSEEQLVEHLYNEQKEKEIVYKSSTIEDLFRI